MMQMVAWLAPVMVFAALVAGRWVGVLPASLLSLALLLAVVLSVGPQLLTLGDVGLILIGGAWIALPAVLVILAGLFFTEVNAVAESGSAQPIAEPGRRLGTTCLFAGPFVETATGFGVGYVVALRAVMGLRVGVAPAIALAALSQCLVPWGALGVGSRISAAIVDMPIEDISWRASVIMAPVMLLMGPVYWRIAAVSGHAVSTAQKLEDFICLIALGLLLILANLRLPIELAGMAALGPVLIFRFWREEGRAALTRRSTIVTVAPYVALIVMLCIFRLVPIVTEALGTIRVTPVGGAPAFAPFLSPAIPLLAVSFAVVLFGERSGQRLGKSARQTLQKGWRACCLTIVLVAFAWLLVRSGITAAIVREIAVFGPLTSVSVPLLGAFGGYLTGSNTGAGSLSMPVAAVFSVARGEVMWLAAAAIVSGSLMTAVSPVRVAMAQALAAASNRDIGAALRLLLPYILLALMSGVVTTVLVRVVSVA